MSDPATLVFLVVLPLFGGMLVWLPGAGRPTACRWICLLALGLDLALALGLWARAPDADGWLARASWEWIPRFGIGVQLGLDGISLLLVLLTLLLGILSVLASWTEITDRVRFFHFNLMWILAGVLGVFLALDLFLFYFFWELMLVPMYFLIGIWGHERRRYAALKFFLFTQASGLLMLVAILGLAFLHRRQEGAYSFSYEDLLELDPGSAGIWLFLGFFVAFAVKLPALGLHTWLPDAHTEAPTAGSVILAGLLLKTGAYGLIRFAVPLFPDAARQVAPFAMVLGAAGVLYGALVAFGQRDLKRLVAYTSVSHLGFVLIGVFAWNRVALQGAVMQMICHGLSTGALFVLAGGIQERLHTREMSRLGGLHAVAPRMSTMALCFALGSLGLPGLGNFVAELLVLVGAFESSPVATIAAAIGLVPATVYSLWILQRVFHGPLGPAVAPAGFRDLSPRELTTQAALLAPLIFLGFYPQPVLDQAAPALDALEQVASRPMTADAR